MPHTADQLTCNHWLAFESSVLRRLQFRSVALPWTGTRACALQLKRWGVRVHANCTRIDELIGGVAHIENNTMRLTNEDIERLTADAYVPSHTLRFPELRRWFGEPEAWWFGNLRDRIEGLPTRSERALAYDIVLRTGRHALAFDDETSYMRASLTAVMRRISEQMPLPIDNNQRNTCHAQTPGEFLAEQQVDLAFIRLPRIAALHTRAPAEWCDVWLRGSEFDTSSHIEESAHRTSHLPSKAQHLHFVEEILRRAAHMPQWAILHAADGFLGTDELVETIRRVRLVKTVYTKDFSEWMGTRVSIITA